MSSQLNQSNTPLEGEAVFTGEWEYHRGWEAVACLINTDQSGTVTYNFSSDIGTTTHHTQSFSVTADVTFNKMVTSKANWFQVVYTNGETNQTSFSLVTTFYRQNTEIELDAGDIMAITAETLPLMDGLTATSGNLEVSLEVDNVGLATSANQTTANTSLSSIASNTSDCAVNTNAIGVDTTSIDTKLTTTNSTLVDIETNTDVLTVVGGGTETGCLRVTVASNSSGVLSVDDNGGSLTVDGTFWQATQPVSASALPLPSGASTSALQGDANGS